MRLRVGDDPRTPGGRGDRSISILSDPLKGLRAITPLPGLRPRVLVLPETEPMRTDDGIDVWSLRHLSDVLAAGALFEADGASNPTGSLSRCAVIATENLPGRRPVREPIRA